MAYIHLDQQQPDSLEAKIKRAKEIIARVDAAAAEPRPARAEPDSRAWQPEDFIGKSVATMSQDEFNGWLSLGKPPLTKPVPRPQPKAATMTAELHREVDRAVEAIIEGTGKALGEIRREERQITDAAIEAIRAELINLKVEVQELRRAQPQPQPQAEIKTIPRRPTSFGDRRRA